MWRPADCRRTRGAAGASGVTDPAVVQIVENHAEIEGVLSGIAPSPDRPGFVVLTIEVRNTHPVGNSPNLFTQDVGKTLSVLARVGSEQARAAPGPIRLKVRKGGPTTIFAE